MKKHRKKTLIFWLVIGILFGLGCGSEENEEKKSISAGTIGKCIKVQVYPGYTTCIMDKPQSLGTEIKNGMLQQALIDGLPQKVNHRTGYIDLNCPEVHDQGQCGWCVAHATTAAIEAFECQTKKSERISEPHLWYLGDGDVDNCLGGWHITEALKTVRDNSLVPNSVWPYFAHENQMSTTKPSDEILEANAKYSISNYIDVAGNEIRMRLAQGGNVICAVPVFCDAGWYYYNSQGEVDANIGNIIAPDKNFNIARCVLDGEQFTSCQASAKPFCRIGYHAILLVGYDDDVKQFILRNSWGTGWADNGYSNISYDYIENFAECSLLLKDVNGCGNGSCDWGESCDSCPNDCGSCSSGCGDGNCDTGENYQSCPQDCQCVQDCAGKVCGDDGCGGNCGICASGYKCQNYQCVEESCAPDCGGKECGDDGCGNVCGNCLNNQTCNNGECVGGCVPNCGGKECGDDGCGSAIECGYCDSDSGFQCVNYECVKKSKGILGDPCNGDGDCTEGMKCLFKIPIVESGTCGIIYDKDCYNVGAECEDLYNGTCCESASSGDGWCIKKCKDSSDCLSGYHCGVLFGTAISCPAYNKGCLP